MQITGLPFWVAFAVAFSWTQPPRAEVLPTVAIVTTGGTIAEKTDPKSGGAVSAVPGENLVAAVPGLRDLANIMVVEYSNIDSSQMTPELWAGLSHRVDQLLADSKVAGAVVVHGTDTMAQAAYFLDMTIKSDKPVVFTGAMNDASSLSPDGPGNIYNAVVQVLSDKAQDWGVTVTLNRYVNSAADVRKEQTTNVQTFESGEKGYLGYVFGNDVVRINNRVHRIRIPLPGTLPKELPKVPILYAYAGADGALIRMAVDGGVQGLVIEGVGAGNVNEAVDEAIKYALSKGTPVVVRSRVYYGADEPTYGDIGGGATLERQGAILAGALTSPKARLLLIVALQRYGNDPAKIKEAFSQVRGAP